MLPRAHRLTSPADFREVVRRGRRKGASTLVVHLHLADVASVDAVRVGVVASKAVGNAVVRNRVKRRLRHLTLAELPGLPRGARLVVRALPPAAEASYAELGRDLSRSLDRVRATGPAGQEVGS